MTFLRKNLHSILPARKRRAVQAIQAILLYALISATGAAGREAPVLYTLDLRAPKTHIVKVEMTIPGAPVGTRIQFPTWNALYQIRDFVRNVRNVQAVCDGRRSGLAREDANTWRLGSGQCETLVIHYSVYANEEPPFSSGLNEHHGFLNFAMLLFYLPEARDRGAHVSFLLPDGWKLATLIDPSDNPHEFDAPSYDALADSPVEAGDFHEVSYQQNGTTYRAIIDANPEDYSADRLVKFLENITTTETELMQDVPFKTYTFIFHFLREGGGGGGMEHADGTAISVSAATLKENWPTFESVTAHEFFHLWNVKRIRPAALEPVDYIHGNDTGNLWFAEGVTSTYQELILLRAGIISRDEFYRRIALQIRILEDRPAHLFQSVEESSRSAWLEKYTDYLRIDRSISYYNKGEILGFLLDLAIRQGSQNRHSLDSLLRRLNEDLAKRGRFYTQSDLRAAVADLASGFTQCDEFFRDYVSGTREIDYNTYFQYAGLHLAANTVEHPVLGFEATKKIGEPVEVQSVEEGGNADKAGLRAGDILLTMNGSPLSTLPERQLGSQSGGSKVEFEVQRGSRKLRISYRPDQMQTTAYRLEELPQATENEVRIRKGWLEGKTE
jgi:predicted metalloprotease with PDZ domain